MKLTKKNLDFLDDLFDKLLTDTDKDMTAGDHVEPKKISTDESTDVQTQH